MSKKVEKKLMKQDKSIFVNTFTLYAKIIISGVVTLLSTRVALQLLGVDDFGLYNLVAGIIAMLSFLNGALLVSTQRFLSVAMGEGQNKIALQKIFNSSLFIHLVFASLLLLLLVALKPFLFSSVLNINQDSVIVAKKVYDIMILSSFVTILTVPYNAAINAHEEMWMFAIIESVVALLKLGAAYALYITPYNLLLTYSVLMFFAILVGGICKYFWCRIRYEEIRILIKEMYNVQLIKQQIGFVGWNTLGSIAVLGRNQGIAVVLNMFFGTLLNAAYGVANQLNVLVSTFAATITTVFSPIIMKYKGQGDRKQMLYMASLSSRISFLLSSIMALPILLELDNILNVWLTEVPDYTLQITRGTIITFVIMQIYPGITRAIYAEGVIKWYQIVISVTILTIIPIGYFSFKLGASPVCIIYCMVIAQILVLVETLYFAYKLIGLDWRHFFIEVLKSILVFVIVYILMSYLKRYLCVGIYPEIFIVTITSILLFVLLCLFVCFSSLERNFVKCLLSNMIK